MPSNKWRDFGNHTYALTGGSNIGVIVHEGAALMVDAGLDPDTARKALRELAGLNADPVAIALTHGHADHFGAPAGPPNATRSPSTPRRSRAPSRSTPSWSRSFSTVGLLPSRSCAPSSPSPSRAPVALSL